MLPPMPRERTPSRNKEGANYIGNGTNDKWATPCRGEKRRFCRASGCGKEMERCCYIKTIAGRPDLISGLKRYPAVGAERARGDRNQPLVHLCTERKPS